MKTIERVRMNHIEISTPAPHCPLSACHPARAHVPACQTDVARTFAEHSTIDLLDDYDLTSRTDYLEQMGAFK